MKRKSFISIMICLIVGTLLVGCSNNTKENSSKKESSKSKSIEEKSNIPILPYEWSTNNYVYEVPTPDASEVTVEADTTISFVANVKGNQEQCDSYIQKCIDAGFTESSKKVDDMGYAAYNLNGVRVAIMAMDIETSGEYTVKIDSSVINENLVWPTSGFSNALPIPESKKGRIDFDTDSSFLVNVADTTQEQFDKYAEQCKEKGFSAEYSKYPEGLVAKDAKGNTLIIEYTGINTMIISLSSNNN